MVLQNSDNRLSRPHFDWPLCLVTFALAIFGVIAVSITNFDPSLEADRPLLKLITDSGNGSWQAIYLLISPIAIAGVMFFSYQFLGRIWPVLYGVCCVLLLAALSARYMVGESGTFSRWLTLIWDRTLQPSELVKIAVIISLSSELSRHEKPIPNVRYFLRLMVHVGVPMILIILQPDIGTMLVLIVIFFTLLLASGCSLKLWFGMVTGGVTALIPVGMYLARTENFRWMRLVSFIDPELYSDAGGYQVLHSMLAVGAGGLRGVGMFVDGTLTQLNYVPENHTDFIFSSIGETMGFIGCMILLTLYGLLFYRMLLLAYNTPDRFGRLIILGVMSMLVFHVFENIGMNIGVMPITGIPLPFISFGGSNLIANMGGVALVLNVTRRKRGVRKRF